MSFQSTGSYAEIIRNHPLRERSAAPKVSHSYFVCMCDYGQRGLEAVVQPEVTRRGIVERIASGEYKHVAFVHHVDGLYVEDLTEDLLSEAEAIALQAAE